MLSLYGMTSMLLSLYCKLALYATVHCVQPSCGRGRVTRVRVRVLRLLRLLKF
jgi:hypothetical protein